MKYTFHNKYTGDPELSAHDGEQCTIIAELDNEKRDPEVGPMFCVIFETDLSESNQYFDVFSNELDPMPESKLLRWIEAEEMWEENA